ncbi:response regulator [Deinococcus aerophilus]|uniref:Response regulatory domain-containing protein n=1 Tax=Deinococcus aerophilus TaxID=522488 RepID=A0ABQ2GQW8_9DEIO|nr:response regulator [Deinococcus aerophilus]GGM07052.1 hypothetical protein GCM10010841_14070 [Deinococcus aerophilus]
MSGLRLLVVEDELQILELLDLTLTLRGYVVHGASSGPQALELCCQGTSPVTADVIVMDVLMTPWDGFETVRRLHGHYGAALPPVVFLSGLHPPDAFPDLGGDLVQEYLMKPFRPAQLAEAIERVWARRPS